MTGNWVDDRPTVKWANLRSRLELDALPSGKMMMMD